jgi:hypothetical protein
VRAVESDGPLQEADRRRCLLVGENLDVGEAGAVIDADVDAFVADRLAANT